MILEQGEWLLGLTFLEVCNPVFKKLEEISNFSLTSTDFCTDPVIMKGIENIIALTSLKYFELQVYEVIKLEISSHCFSLSDLDAYSLRNYLFEASKKQKLLILRL